MTAATYLTELRAQASQSSRRIRSCGNGDPTQPVQTELKQGGYGRCWLLERNSSA
jgi:hypothetical protein